jgi:L,D-transpeptidase ErfK/SrfK
VKLRGRYNRSTIFQRRTVNNETMNKLPATPAITSVFRSVLMLMLCASAPLSAQTFPLPPPGEDIVGEVRSVEAVHEDTLIDLARRNNLGYEEIEQANPGVDPWLPGAGTVVVLPNRFILPPVPRVGIVLNVPEMRLYYYPKPKKGEQPVVVTYPVSVGRMDWKTPIAVTRVVAKHANPTWTVPDSILAEHAAKGDYLPKVVPAGPDNPLGLFAMSLGIKGYLIHGTNNPNGLGMRVTHGCMRLYPDDIKALFKIVPVGTPVRIVNMPYKVGRHNGQLYLEAHPPLAEDRARYRNTTTSLVEAVVTATRDHEYSVDWEVAQQVVAQPLGIPVLISNKPKLPSPSSSAVQAGAVKPGQKMSLATTSARPH